MNVLEERARAKGDLPKRVQRRVVVQFTYEMASAIQRYALSIDLDGPTHMADAVRELVTIGLAQAPEAAVIDSARYRAAAEVVKFMRGAFLNAIEDVKRQTSSAFGTGDLPEER